MSFGGKGKEMIRKGDESRKRKHTEGGEKGTDPRNGGLCLPSLKCGCFSHRWWAKCLVLT